MTNQPMWTDIIQTIMYVVGPFIGAYVAYEYAVRQMHLNRDSEFLLKLLYDTNQLKEVRLQLWRARHGGLLVDQAKEDETLKDINELKGLVMAHEVCIELMFSGKGKALNSALQNLRSALPPDPDWLKFFDDLEPRVERVREEIRKLWKVLNPSASDNMQACCQEGGGKLACK